MIEAALIKAVIHVESGGSTTAKSVAGAKGLMQLMDDTGKEWHKILGISEPYDPYDPDQNEKIGSAYLKWLLEQFDYNTEFALAAYNWGIGRVKKVIKQRNAKTYADIESALPRETRHYVRSVLDNRERILKA